MRRSFFVVLPLLACACRVSFESGGIPNRPTPDRASDDRDAAETASGLVRGLGTVEPGVLSADVHFLSSDALEGRDTPSRGLNIAAEYLRTRVEQLGWQPGAGDDYFHPYRLVEKTLWPARTFAAAQKEDARIAFQETSDYVFRARPLVDHEVTGDLVYVGTASVEETAKLDLTGRWALCTEHPNVGWRERAAAVRARGAIGLLVTPGPVLESEGPAASYGERFAAWADDRNGLILPDHSEPAFPLLFVEQHAAQRLLEFAGETEPIVGRAIGVSFTETRTFDGHGEVRVSNVSALWPGSDPDLAQEVIVITAHYDHVGKNAEGAIYNGADDNASGCAALLSLAEAIAEAGGLRRTIMLLWVSGEEKGLLGSAAWARDPVLPEDSRVVANINVDMVGRNDPDQILMTPSSEHHEHNQLARLVEKNAGSEGFDRVDSADAYWFRSDHANFSRYLSVPVIFLFTNVHEDYHQPTDTAEKLDYDKAARVTRLILRVLFDFDARD